MKSKGILISSTVCILFSICLVGSGLMKQQQLQAAKQPQEEVYTLTAMRENMAAPIEMTQQVLHQEPEATLPNQEEQLPKKGQLPQEDRVHTVAILGMDQGGYRPDVIIGVTLDQESGATQITSIPRDTYIEWSHEASALARANGFEITESKINEMLAYGGTEHLRELTLTEMERLLEREVDHYIVVTLDLFRKVVDAIGGVEVDVPSGIPGLASGTQVLDGEAAERMVRFRGYTHGDLGRIEAQQIFLKGVVKTLREPSTWLKLPKLIDIFFEEIDTDIGLGDLNAYYKFLKIMDKQQINFCTLQGTARYKGSKSYFFVNE